MNNILYCIVKLLNGSNLTVEVPSTWLVANDKPVNVNRVHCGAFYYCTKYESGCEVLEIL